jgi:hypothetical protein
MSKYSVLLLHPDYANEGGDETYYAFVEAAHPKQAIEMAKKEAGTHSDMCGDDFAALLVLPGHRVGLSHEATEILK